LTTQEVSDGEVESDARGDGADAATGGGATAAARTAEQRARWSEADGAGGADVRCDAQEAEGDQVMGRVERTGQLCVIHVPRHVLLDVVEDAVPSGFTTIVFAQWSEDRDVLLIGFADGEERTMRLTNEVVGALN